MLPMNIQCGSLLLLPPLLQHTHKFSYCAPFGQSCVSSKGFAAAPPTPPPPALWSAGSLIKLYWPLRDKTGLDCTVSPWPAQWGKCSSLSSRSCCCQATLYRKSTRNECLNSAPVFGLQLTLYHDLPPPCPHCPPRPLSAALFYLPLIHQFAAPDPA